MKKLISLIAISFTVFGFSTANAQGLFTKDLYFGIQSDSEVTKLQEFLTAEKLYSNAITGNFYSLTLKAVKDFQKREGINPASGYFGPKTRERLNIILGSQLSGSNNQATLETGSFPSSVPPPKTDNELFNILQQQISILLQKLAELQKQTQNQIQQQQRTLEQITQSIAISTQVQPQVFTSTMPFAITHPTIFVQVPIDSLDLHFGYEICASPHSIFFSITNPKKLIVEININDGEFVLSGGEQQNLKPDTVYKYTIKVTNESKYALLGGSIKTRDLANDYCSFGNQAFDVWSDRGLN